MKFRQQEFKCPKNRGFYAQIGIICRLEWARQDERRGIRKMDVP